MSKLISDAYQKMNYQLHRGPEPYGQGGGRLASHIGHLVKKYDAKSLLDYGCGKGTLKPALQGLCPDLDIREYDPAIPGKTSRPKPADIVICSDVMEHIEPECLDAVLEHIASVTRKIAYLAIASDEAEKTLPDGRNAHLIVQPAEWWLSKVGEYMTIERQKIVENGVMVYAAPRIG